jgi:hypothetical protein
MMPAAPRSGLAATARDIVAAGGAAEAAQVDALDERAVEEHIAAVVKQTGTIDISFNAITPIPQPGTQGIPIAQLSVESFTAPITAYMRSYFLTARAACAAHGRESIRRDPDTHGRACAPGRTTRGWHGSRVGGNPQVRVHIDAEAS